MYEKLSDLLLNGQFEEANNFFKDLTPDQKEEIIIKASSDNKHTNVVKNLIENIILPHFNEYPTIFFNHKKYPHFEVSNFENAIKALVTNNQTATMLKLIKACNNFPRFKDNSKFQYAWAETVCVYGNSKMLDLLDKENLLTDNIIFSLLEYKYAIPKSWSGEKPDPIIFDCFIKAADNSNIDTLKYLFKKLEKSSQITKDNFMNDNNYFKLFNSACRSGNFEIVTLVYKLSNNLDHFRNDKSNNNFSIRPIYSALSAALPSKNKEIILFILNELYRLDPKSTDLIIIPGGIEYELIKFTYDNLSEKHKTKFLEYNISNDEDDVAYLLFNGFNLYKFLLEVVTKPELQRKLYKGALYYLEESPRKGLQQVKFIMEHYKDNKEIYNAYTTNQESSNSLSNIFGPWINLCNQLNEQTKIIYKNKEIKLDFTNILEGLKQKGFTPDQAKELILKYQKSLHDVYRKKKLDLKFEDLQLVARNMHQSYALHTINASDENLWNSLPVEIQYSITQKLGYNLKDSINITQNVKKNPKKRTASQAESDVDMPDEQQGYFTGRVNKKIKTSNNQAKK
ncbi:MAG: hypothetical protein J0G32_03225 [Alphaproteobacteria bacterium]|nr:hypothetical protein [Alphaproteobacteria bacterium]OJV12088.1 MAG: hypothetical protein BGO27_05030 [Alphaproteobacteria bacterium 33-17]